LFELTSKKALEWRHHIPERVEGQSFSGCHLNRRLRRNQRPESLEKEGISMVFQFDGVDQNSICNGDACLF